MTIASIKAEMVNVRHIDADGLNASIEQYTEGSDTASLFAAQKEVGVLLSILEGISRELSIVKLKHAGATKKKAQLNSLKSSITNRNVWSVDYTTGLSGEVNTIEVDGEPTTILVGDFTFDTSKLTEILGQTTAGSLYNFSLTPYWQKWNPTFRIGTITAISGGLASVTLDTATSHYQSLNINQSGTLTNVPFSYLDCNAEAFAVSDEVVVAFTSQDWSTPVIIGFKDNPKECSIKYSFVAVGKDNLYFTGSVSQSILDLGGQSPSIYLEEPPWIGSLDVNYYYQRYVVKDYVSGAYKITSNIGGFGTAEWTIDRSDLEDSGYIRVMLSSPDMVTPYPPLRINPYRVYFGSTGNFWSHISYDTGSPGYNGYAEGNNIANVNLNQWLGINVSESYREEPIDIWGDILAFYWDPVDLEFKYPWRVNIS